MRRGQTTMAAIVLALVGVVASSAFAAGPSWTVDNSPKLPVDSAELRDVACVQPARCYAVGIARTASIPSPITEAVLLRWNGSRWSRTSTPSWTGNSEFFAVACVADGSCMVVGRDEGGPFAMHRTAARWVVDHFTNAPELLDVSCVSSAFCVAAGGTSSGAQGPIWRWDGHSWSSMPTPTTAAVSEALDALTCTTTVDCFAVGASDSTDGYQTPVVLHWNGSAWRAAAVPTLPRHNVVLSGVACRATHDCVAVGYASVRGSDAQHRYALRWRGRRWVAIPTPAPSAASDAFAAVSCAGGECAAVGSTRSQSLVDAPLVDHLTDSGWTLESAQPPAVGQGVFQGVTCDGTHACIAVGTNFLTNSARNLALIERRH